ncbi:hypothetical protein COU58_01815 [Candidatus Pacearchaeota archaeon CG10_big_fil_rev_8_21_14_0_10_32_42]|nr:MAG: hypothetical protein COU58_01815 [Candidatus Pacearchaeota archaeon CG10_big_fil_rev_8_21_14_0_10_32_42]
MVKIFNKNKKGQGLSTSTIVLLILGLIVLVALIWGFVTGWSALGPILNPTNVDRVIQDCSSACSVQSKFSYCSGERSLNVNEDKVKVKSTCAVFASEPSFAKYEIPECPTINCELACSDIKIDGKAGSSTLTSGKYNLSSLANEEACFIN